MSDGTPIIIKKVKGHGGHAHHGGSWKVAYADFVTAMMAFFMVMWIMGLSDDTRTQIQGYFNDPLGFKNNFTKSRTVVSPKSTPGSRSKKQPGKGNGSSAEKATTQDKDEKRLKNMQKQIEAAIAADKSLAQALKGLEITITQDGLRIELVESRNLAFFKTGSAILNPTAIKAIADIVPIIKKQDRYFIVEGHTDSRPYASPGRTNWDLSSDRANALRRELFADGMNPRRCTGLRALADTQLKYPNDPFDDRNRRVTILLPFKSENTSGVKMPKDELPVGPAEQLRDVVVAPNLGPK